MLLTLGLESRGIQLYPKHLNKEQRFRQKRVINGKAAMRNHAAKVRENRDLPSATWRHRGSAPAVRLQLMTLYGNALAPDVVATGPTEAFSSAPSVYVHSSLLYITDRAPIQRLLGKSEVVSLDPGTFTGEQVTGSLTSALRWVSHR